MVDFKLSVVRAFFEYLKAGGIVSLNQASTKLVAVPEVSDEPLGLTDAEGGALPLRRLYARASRG